MKKIISLFIGIVIVLTLAACGKSSTDVSCDDDPTQDKCNVEQTCEENPDQTKCQIDAWGPPTDTAGEISVLLWSGDDSYIEDIGHQNLEPEELFGQNQAATYAVAKEFNKIYPNVKINVLAVSGDPGGASGWAQRLENFKTEYGKYPDVWASMDITGDMKRGLIMDLSVFKDDPLYQTFNPAIMNLMNIYGFQAGLPQYLLPWGIYVNKSLAEQYNIDVPPVDWNIDDYTDFITSADRENFWGAYDVTTMYINTGVSTINAQLSSYDGTGDWLDINSDQVKDLLSYLPVWSDYAVWPERDKVITDDEGNQDDSLSRIKNTDFYEQYGGGWGFTAFINNRILTLGGDPWMMGDAAHPDPDHWGRASMDDWDIYPRFSTDYEGNTVGVVLDPFVSYNYCMLDGDKACNDDELAKAKLTYKFMSFWVGDTRSWEARAAQQFTDGTTNESGIPTTKTALNDSLPFVVGDEFDKQIDAWYSVDIHQRFADASKMPGWQEILRLWQDGQIWDVSDKAFPWFYDNEGTLQPIMYEWLNLWDINLVGAYRYEQGWLDLVKSKLPDWNTAINQRFDDYLITLQDGMKEYYNYTDADFAGNFKPSTD